MLPTSVSLSVALILICSFLGGCSPNLTLPFSSSSRLSAPSARASPGDAGASISGTPPATKGPTPSPQITVIATAAPLAAFTLHATPLIHIQESFALEFNERIDLDDGSLQSIHGADPLITESEMVEGTLSPIGGTRFARYSDAALTPGPIVCQMLLNSLDPIRVQGLAVGDILCYSTGDEKIGFLRIRNHQAGFDFVLITWV